MLKQLGRAGLLASVAMAGTATVPARADDAFVQQAKAFVAQVTAPAPAWSGPTTGPTAQPRKLVVYISTDQRNGGARGVGEGMEEAAKVIGWEVRTIDGQGSVSGRSSGLAQAVALKADAVVLGGIDAAEQASAVEQAVQAGIKVAGWHVGPKPGPIASPPVFTNITTDPIEVAKAAAFYAVADSDGKAGVVILTDSVYKIAIAKSDAMAAVVKQCSGCKLLSVDDTPLSDSTTRMPQLTTSMLQRFGPKWTYTLGINDLYFDFMQPALQAAGVPGDGIPHNVSAGDGSDSAFQRIRDKDYQVGTVAEPLRMQGWQLVDELNRAFAGQPPSGFVAPPHLFVAANIDKDGGAQNTYDPANGYRDAYRKIWGK